MITHTSLILYPVYGQSVVPYCSTLSFESLICADRMLQSQGSRQLVYTHGTHSFQHYFLIALLFKCALVFSHPKHGFSVSEQDRLGEALSKNQ